MSTFLRSIPLLAIPTLIYAAFALPMGQEGALDVLNATFFSITLPSGDVLSPRWADVLLGFAAAMLFVEIVKSAQPVTSSMIENGLALLLFTLQLIFFLLVTGFGTVSFAMIMGMTLLDFAAGAMVMIYSARRDVQYHTA